MVRLLHCKVDRNINRVTVGHCFSANLSSTARGLPASPPGSATTVVCLLISFSRKFCANCPMMQIQQVVQPCGLSTQFVLQQGC